jgi:hypothetical protein
MLYLEEYEQLTPFLCSQTLLSKSDVTPVYVEVILPFAKM